MGWVLLKTLASLAAVLGLMFVLVIVLKKTMGGFQTSKAALISVDLLGHRMLQPKRSIVVVKVLNKIMIIGMTEEGMTMLGEIGDADILHWVDATMAETASGSGGSSAKAGTGVPFVEYLSRNIGILRPRSRRGAAGNLRPEIEGEN
ncbi:MAG TPA: flagellar biosynthetic protein FliO [Bacteroidota bacterium]|nr:flagellar biosynthetic protein FliO [Bacteroidota bacterium]